LAFISRRAFRYFCALLLLSGCLALAGSPVAAQSQTEITTQPYPIYLTVGQTANISVWVEDAVNVSSYYLQLYFNPNLVQIKDANPTIIGEQVYDGSFFTPNYVTINYVNNPNGSVTYVNYFYVNGQPMSIGGSGILISFDMVAIASGTSTIHLSQSYLVDSLGVVLPVVFRNPQLYTSVSSVVTSTETATPTVLGPTFTPTPTTSPTPTSTATFLPGATASALFTATPSATAPAAGVTVTPAASGVAGPGTTQPTVTQGPGTVEPTAVANANIPQAAYTHTPLPLPTSPPVALLVTPPVLLATPAPGLFEGLGPVGWIAVILALVWLVGMVGYLIYHFALKKPDNPG